MGTLWNVGVSVLWVRCRMYACHLQTYVHSSSCRDVQLCDIVCGSQLATYGLVILCSRGIACVRI